MEKINSLSEQEQEFRPFNTLFFQDEYNSEMPIFDDYTEPAFDDPLPQDDEEE